jgi:GMP synthase (glutamine-hydrolysing)
MRNNTGFHYAGHSHENGIKGIYQKGLVRMIIIFQHGTGEPPGYILEIIENRGLPYEIIRPYKGEPVPEQVTGSHYIYLGGLMSVNDEEQYPWLTLEKMLIRDAVLSGVPVLGVCLGAQMIASSFSQNVCRCTEEKGWTVIRNQDRSGPENSCGEVTVFEWHGECFDLPAGSSLAYSGEVVTNQMFTFGSATGVQFHPEVTESIIRQWVAGGNREVRDKILQATPAYIGQSKSLCSSIMDQFLRTGD